MSLVDRLITGSRVEPLRLVVHGRPGAGKTTLASWIPGALVLTPETEDGAGDLSLARVVTRGWTDLYGALQEVAGGRPGPDGLECGVGFPVRTLVLDTVSALEVQIWAHLGGGRSIELVGGGYGKGYTQSAELMGEALATCERIRRLGVNIVLLGHTAPLTVDPPDGPAYTALGLRLHKAAAERVTQWADVVAMLDRDVSVEVARQPRQASDSVLTRGKLAEAGPRVLRLGNSPWHMTKCRLAAPEVVPAEWPAIAQALRWDAHRRPAAPTATVEQVYTLLGKRMGGLGVALSVQEAGAVLMGRPLEQMDALQLGAMVGRLERTEDAALRRRLLSQEEQPAPPSARRGGQ